MLFSVLCPFACTFMFNSGRQQDKTGLPEARGMGQKLSLGPWGRAGGFPGHLLPIV